MTVNKKQQVAEKKALSAPTNNLLGRTGFDRDHLVVHEGKRSFGGEAKGFVWNGKVKGLQMSAGSRAKTAAASYTSPVILCKFAATEFLPSWNIKLYLPDQSFVVSLRFFEAADGKPSPWFMVGEGGSPRSAKAVTEVQRWGKTQIDYVDLKKPAVAFQYKIEVSGTDVDAVRDGEGAVIRRMFVHYSGQGSTAKRAKTAGDGRRERQIPVPYRSQLDVEREDLRHHICCPTSLAMVLEHYGINRPTLQVCEEVYDARYKMHGVWPRTSHAAYQHGLKSWISRFRSHEEVRDYLSTGKPLIASIRVGEGELRNARYPRSNGHIIVITGYRKNGSYVVNDPYSAGPTGAEIDYFAEDIEKVWLDKGGVAVLLEEEK